MANFKQIGDGLFIGPQPTVQDLLEGKQRGIQTVIDMRMPGETATSNGDQVRSNGLNYVNVPVNKTALSEQQVDELNQVMQRTPGPHLLHCATGTRAALLLALGHAKQNGWTAERTFKEAQTMGFDLQGSADFASLVRQVTGK
jgi:uncharacterized protein (TIGR01244 family)